MTGARDPCRGQYACEETALTIHESAKSSYYLLDGLDKHSKPMDYARMPPMRQIGYLWREAVSVPLPNVALHADAAVHLDRQYNNLGAAYKNN